MGKGGLYGTADKKVLFSNEKDYWETPQWLFDSLNEKYHFTLDSAASDENHKCSKYFTKEDDGLSQDWGGIRSFVTPPLREQGDRRMDS